VLAGRQERSAAGFQMSGNTKERAMTKDRVFDEHPLTDGECDALVGIKGMFRVKIESSTGEVVGDSGWRKNVVMKDGLEWIIYNSFQENVQLAMHHVELGSGTDTLVYTDVALGGAIGYDLTDCTPGGPTSDVPAGQMTWGVDAASDQWSSIQFLATFSAGWNSDGQCTIREVGVYDSDGDASGTLFAGNNFPESEVAVDQAVNVTYVVYIGSQ